MDGGLGQSRVLVADPCRSGAKRTGILYVHLPRRSPHRGGLRSRTSVRTPSMTRGTQVATALAVCVAQVALAIPAVLNGQFQQDLGTTSAQLTWISDAFLVP